MSCYIEMDVLIRREVWLLRDSGRGRGRVVVIQSRSLEDQVKQILRVLGEEMAACR